VVGSGAWKWVGILSGLGGSKGRGEKGSYIHLVKWDV
jgi:hypothetical protein